MSQQYNAMRGMCNLQLLGRISRAEAVRRFSRNRQSYGYRCMLQPRQRLVQLLTGLGLQRLQVLGKMECT